MQNNFFGYLPSTNVIEHARRLDEVRTNAGGVHAVRANVFQFEAKRLIESNSGELAGTVVDQLRDARVAGQRGNRHDVAVVLLQHLRQEGFGGLRDDAKIECIWIME